jgi:predicted acylesterase/phospholipase RssA
MNIQNIVINGGGPSIFNAYGALKQSNLSGIWSHDSVESYYGTSAGSILAVILALQYSWEDLDDFIIKRPWQHVWKFNLLNVYEYYTNKGVYGKELIDDCMGPLFKGKDIELTITMKEFHELFNKKLFLYAVNIATFELTEFSHLTHPNMTVLDAMRASSALPILFQPVEYDGKFYTDGGFLLNYPLIKCTADPKTILGVKNIYTDCNTKVNDIQGIFEYLSYLLNMIVDKIQFRNNSASTTEYELEINTGFIDYSTILNLANNQIDRQILINRGVDDALKSIEKIHKKSLLLL